MQFEFLPREIVKSLTRWSTLQYMVYHYGNDNFAMITFRYLILAAQCHMQVLGHFVLYYCIFNQDMCGHIRTSMYGIIIMIS